jgi:hypothetical protein
MVEAGLSVCLDSGQGIATISEITFGNSRRFERRIINAVMFCERLVSTFPTGQRSCDAADEWLHGG